MEEYNSSIDLESNPDFETEKESEIEASAPVIPSNSQKEVPAETIEISNKNIINHLKPQENKYWHFTFKNEANKNQMTRVLQNIPGYNLTVEYGIPVNSPDVTLKNNGETIGKIHLLLSDRRDANLPEKYYCKLYFYHFKNPELYQSVKTALVNFFENFKSNNKTGGKRNKLHKKIKTHKKRPIYRRKKTLKRN
jgi:hypothetical protein